MGGCCARQQELYFDKKNCFQYSTDDIIKISQVVKPELNLERKKQNVKEEELQLSKIIIELKKIFKNRVTTITEIELFNLAIYNKESFINSDYLIFDMRKSCDQKEEYLKRIRHINYTYEQVKNIEKINKLELLRAFINNKKIILIIAVDYLNPKNNKEGYKNVQTYPIELCHLFHEINNNISFIILNSCLYKESEEQNNKLEDYLSCFQLYDIIPFVLLSYSHVTTFYKEGYCFISFLNKGLFIFEELVKYISRPDNNINNEIYHKIKFINDMNITCVINIDNSSQKNFEIKEYQYQNIVYKEINIKKEDMKNQRRQILDACEWIKQEIQKGHSCYFNIEHFDKETNNLEYNIKNNSWVFVVIVLISNLVEVDYINVITYLKEKMIYIDNITEIINENINKEEMIETLNYLNS